VTKQVEEENQNTGQMECIRIGRNPNLNESTRSIGIILTEGKPQGKKSRLGFIRAANKNGLESKPALVVL